MSSLSLVRITTVSHEVKKKKPNTTYKSKSDQDHVQTKTTITNSKDQELLIRKAGEHMNENKESEKPLQLAIKSS
jgi:hypothetical protein